MSARNVILAVLGLAVVAGGAAYFMMKGTSGTEGAAVEPAPAVEESAEELTAPPVDETGAAGVSESESDTMNADEAGTVEEPAGESLDDAAGAEPDSSPDTLGDLTGPDADTAEGLADENAKAVNTDEEAIDETLEESSEAPEQPASEPNL